MTAAPICAVAHDWLVRSRRPHARAVLERLQALEPDLARTGAASLVELLAHVSDPPPDAPVPHWLVTAALVRRLEVDELVGVGILAALRPGLLAVARRLHWGRGGPWSGSDAFAGDLVSTSWDVLRSVAGTTLAYPERTVLRRVRQRLEWQRTALRRCTASERPVADVELMGRLVPVAVLAAACEDVRVTTLPVLDALGAALAATSRPGLPREDLALVFAHRVLGFSLREIASRQHLATTTVRLRSRRAEEVLCAISC